MSCVEIEPHEREPLLNAALVILTAGAYPWTASQSSIARRRNSISGQGHRFHDPARSHLDQGLSSSRSDLLCFSRW